MKTIKIFFEIFNLEQKRNFYYLFFLMLIAMLLETLGLGLIIPSVSFLINSDIINNYPIITKILAFIKDNLGFGFLLNNFDIRNQFLLISIITLIIVYLFKNVILTFISWEVASFTTKFQSYWPNKLFSIYLKQPYYFHVKYNSAYLLRNMHEIFVLVNGVRSILTIILEFLIFFGIISFLIYFQPKVSLIIFPLFLLIFILIINITRKILGKMGEKEHFYNAKANQHMLQGFHGVKELKILNKESYFANEYHKFNKERAIINRNLEFINSSPKFIIESIAILFLTIPVIFTIISLQSVTSIITIITVYAISLFRLLPSLNKIIVQIQNIKFINPVINNLHSEFKLEEKLEKNNKKKLEFNNSIHLQNIFYKYEGKSEFTLKNIEIKIDKNEIIGIMGSTGSGKSTLINLINGLLKPTSGKISVDEEDIQTNLSEWQKNIGYVPQNIFLLDDTIRKNIAFGFYDKDIDENLLNQSVKSAELEDTIKKLPEGLSSFVGERGAKLSGGEIQRIGIARALYNNSSILIFDEFTSNLDFETEKKILDTILRLKGKKTIILISHKLGPIQICNKIFKVQNGSVIIS